MINRFLILVLIFSSSFSFSQTLSAELEMPQTVEVGSDFIVKITVTKSNINGFMRYYQKLPANYTASVVDAKGGSFVFKDSIVKIIWISPPSEDVYSFSYKLKVPENAKNEEPFVAAIDYTIELKSESFAFSDKFIRLNQPVTENVVIEKTEETQPATIPVEEKSKEAEPPVVTQTENYTYAVQIGAFTTQPKFTGVKELKMIKLNNGITKYFSGNFKTRAEAEKRRDELRSGGRFQDAFIVKLQEGKIAQ